MKECLEVSGCMKAQLAEFFSKYDSALEKKYDMYIMYKLNTYIKVLNYLITYPRFKKKLLAMITGKPLTFLRYDAKI